MDCSRVCGNARMHGEIILDVQDRGYVWGRGAVLGSDSATVLTRFVGY